MLIKSSRANDVDQRRTAYAAAVQAETGIDEAMIERQVHGFYRAAREDDLLGPVFAAKVADWDKHLPQMCAFWSSVALMSGRYHGSPMSAHLPLPIDETHFRRWLTLWGETARAQCPPEAAERFIALAGRIGESLALGIQVHKGELPELKGKGAEL